MSNTVQCRHKSSVSAYLPRDTRGEVLDDDAVLRPPRRAVLVHPAVPAATSTAAAAAAASSSAIASRTASVLHRNSEKARRIQKQTRNLFKVRISPFAEKIFSVHIMYGVIGIAIVVKLLKN
jgi:hypothetical protein